MDMTIIPPWMSNLDDEDMTFIKRFLLASGSMKEVAAQYGVSYPTVRLRLDRLIQKIQLGEDQAWRAGGRGAVYRAHQTARGR